MTENVDRRVLAGFRCVDAITGGSIAGPLRVDGPDLWIRRNISGIFAVMDAPGLSAFTSDFVAPQPASWPAPSNFTISIQDPSLRYQPRRAQIAVPQPLPLTTPQDVVLYPGPAASMGLNWAVVRASLSSNATPPAPLPWAIIRVSVDGRTPVNGVTNQLGEALVAVQGLGLRLSSSGDGAVMEATTPATVTALFDASALTQAKGWVSNPDDILSNPSSTNWKTASAAVQLAPGQTVYVNLTIPP